MNLTKSTPDYKVVKGIDKPLTIYQKRQQQIERDQKRWVAQQIAMGKQRRINAK